MMASSLSRMVELHNEYMTMMQKLQDFVHNEIKGIFIQHNWITSVSVDLKSNGLFGCSEPDLASIQINELTIENYYKNGNKLHSSLIQDFGMVYHNVVSNIIKSIRQDWWEIIFWTKPKTVIFYPDRIDIKIPDPIIEESLEKE